MKLHKWMAIAAGLLLIAGAGMASAVRISGADYSSSTVTLVNGGELGPISSLIPVSVARLRSE